MTAPNTSTWDTASGDGGARRPAFADVGLGPIGETLLIDDDRPGGVPPKDGTQFYKDLCTQWERQLVAMGRVLPLFIITIDWSGVNPFIDKLQSPSVNLQIADFTVIKNADGDTTLQVANTKVPPLVQLMPANNDLSDTTVGAIIVASPPAGTVQVRIQTYTTGALAKKRASVAVY